MIDGRERRGTQRAGIRFEPGWVTVAGLSLFALALGALHADAINSRVFADIQQWTIALPDAWWAMVTICGTGLAAYALLSPTLCWKPRLMAGAIPGGLLAAVHARVLKTAVPLPRPAGVLDAANLHVIGETLRAHSFPSGHVVTAFTLASVIVFSSRTPSMTACWAVPLAVVMAISRIAVVPIGPPTCWPARQAAGSPVAWA